MAWASTVSVVEIILHAWESYICDSAEKYSVFHITLLWQLLTQQNTTLVTKQSVDGRVRMSFLLTLYNSYQDKDKAYSYKCFWV